MLGSLFGRLVMGAVLVCGIVIILIIQRTPDRPIAFGASAGDMHQLLSALPEPAPSPLPPRADLPEDAIVLSVAEVAAMRGLLFSGQTDSLEALLAASTARARADVAGEDALYDAYDMVFVPVDERFEIMLADWVDSRPASPYARLARAAWWNNIGRQRRGSGTAGRTADSAFRGMLTAFDSARADLEVALRADPSAIAGYWLAIELAVPRGDVEAQRIALRRALRLSPLSYFSRARALLGARPRWGGSYALMRTIARDAEAHAAANPALGSLARFVDWDRGDRAWGRKQMDSARAFLDSTVTRGTNYWFSLTRGEFAEDQDRHAEAITELRRAMAARPARPEPHYWLALASWNTAAQGGEDWWGALQRAQREIHDAAALDSSYNDTREDMRSLDSIMTSYRGHRIAGTVGRAPGTGR